MTPAEARGEEAGPRERAARGVLIFWSALGAFVVFLAFWMPRHRRRAAPPDSFAERSSSPTSSADGAASRAIPGSAVVAPRDSLPGATPPVSPAGSPALSMPIAGLSPRELRDSFEELHSGHRHEAIDILAPRGTPVRAVSDGTIRKLFRSVPGGITIYEFDPGESLCFYYAHLDRYAPGIAEGMRVRAGDTIGYVGTTGNAPPETPHLHFAISRLGPEKRWWQGTPIDPYPLLVKARPAF